MVNTKFVRSQQLPNFYNFNCQYLENLVSDKPQIPIRPSPNPELGFPKFSTLYVFRCLRNGEYKIVTTITKFLQLQLPISREPGVGQIPNSYQT